MISRNAFTKVDASRHADVARPAIQTRTRTHHDPRNVSGGYLQHSYTRYHSGSLAVVLHFACLASNLREAAVVCSFFGLQLLANRGMFVATGPCFEQALASRAVMNLL